MSDERTGRELTPRPEEEQGAVTPREPALPQPSTAPAERFHAGEGAHTVGLTEERAAKIVRQSGNARFMAFLGALVLVLFIPFYWIYDIGLPFLGIEGRMAAEEQGQYVTDVARGHELYLANCARCHGNSGEGGIGPPLNDQGKLWRTVTEQGEPDTRGHLDASYIRQVLYNGGRVVCGDPASAMPQFLQPDDTDPNRAGSLNYREIEEIIAFMLASNEISWVAHEAHHDDPAAEGQAEVAEDEVFHGWRDPNYEPPPDATPPPACWRAPAGTPAPTSPEPVDQPGTVESPREIEIHAADGAALWVDPESGDVLNAITIVAGETIEFVIVNDTPIPHNFHIESEGQLAVAPEHVDYPGVDTFTNGTRSFVHTFDDIPEQPQFACTFPGHYGSMHGDFLVVQPNGEPANGENGENGENGASPAPGEE